MTRLCTACNRRPRRGPKQVWCLVCHNAANTLARQRDPMVAAKSMAYWIGRMNRAPDDETLAACLARADEARQSFTTFVRISAATQSPETRFQPESTPNDP